MDNQSWEYIFKKFNIDYHKEGNNYYISLKSIISNKSINYTEINYFITYLYSYTLLMPLDYLITLNYNNSEIIIKELSSRMKNFYFEIDYDKRNEYIDSVYEINNIINKGRVTLFVNNIPLYLRACVYVECTNDELTKVLEIAKKYNLIFKTDKGIKDFFADMGNRMWNSVDFHCNESKEIFDLIFNSMFYYKTTSQLQKEGYNFSSESVRKKVFISYSWNDDVFVENFVNQLKYSGISVWIDKQSIDFGDNILESCLSGLNECDAALIFISKNYSTSAMAKQELITFWSKAIKLKKKMYVIKIDDVNPDEIFFGLSDLKYFVPGKDSIELLAESLKRNLNNN